MKSLGYAARAADEDLAPLSIERREPRPDDVVIEVLFCGVCHTDLHIARNHAGRTSYPVVPGHEIIGRVTETRLCRHAHDAAIHGRHVRGPAESRVRGTCGAPRNSGRDCRGRRAAALGRRRLRHRARYGHRRRPDGLAGLSLEHILQSMNRL